MSRLYKDGVRLKLVLNKRERKTLTHILNRSSKPYQRERAAALLKVADGMSPHAVAHNGLLKKRDPDTVYGWVKAFDSLGIKSLSHAVRRGKPSLTQGEEEQLIETITEKSPLDFSINRSRWTLKTLRNTLPFLKRIYRSISGVWYLLQHLRIHYKRSYDFLPSPRRRRKRSVGCVLCWDAQGDNKTKLCSCF